MRSSKPQSTRFQRGLKRTNSKSAYPSALKSKGLRRVLNSVKLAPQAVKLYGGKYIARGGLNETLEGDWHAKRLVILEFPSVQQAKTWLESGEYSEARALRHRYARTNMVVVEGV